MSTPLTDVLPLDVTSNGLIVAMITKILQISLPFEIFLFIKREKGALLIV